MVLKNIGLVLEKVVLDL